MFSKRLEKLESQFVDLEQQTHRFRSHPGSGALPEIPQGARRDLSLVQTYRRYQQVQQELADSQGLLKEETDEEMKAMAREEIQSLKERAAALEEELRFLLLPKDPYDEKNVILEIRAGTGGEEAGLFASDLFRMYSRLAERKGWKLEVLSHSTTGIGGLKEVIASISGQRVYSLLKYESGVHRVQRVPVTESQGRIHTSAVTVAILPEAEEVDVQISPDELRIDVFRSSGPAARASTPPTRQCGSPICPPAWWSPARTKNLSTKNKAKGLKVLRSRLFDLKQHEQQQQIAQERKSQVGSGDRSERIRTYNFPQSRITDHRIGFSIHGLRMEATLDGDLDELLQALGAHYRTKALEQG